jgi:hypothetical protein
MRSKLYIIQTFLFLIFIGCQSSKHTQNLETEKDYIFFIHNKFLEENFRRDFFRQIQRNSRL